MLLERDQSSEQQLTNNRYHEVIVVKLQGKDIVFDNVYLDGKDFEHWWKSLYTLDPTSTKPNIVKDELFLHRKLPR